MGENNRDIRALTDFIRDVTKYQQILTSEEFNELALDGITIPHEQSTISIVFIPLTKGRIS